MQRSSVGAPSGPGVGGLDDGDNRSRNAKAQRRHREKRKAHLKALEESVQVLTAQLEEARLQLGAAAYAQSQRLAYSPESKDVAQLAAENAYLRDENADLRRQLYALRVNYPRSDPPSTGGTSMSMPPSSAEAFGGEVKTEGGPTYASVYSAPPGTVVSPPRLPSSSHGRTQSHPGDFVRDPTAETGSTSSGSYPPPLYQFSTVEQLVRHPSAHMRGGSSSSSSRSRHPSATSAPSASPYIASAPFPTDPRAHALSTPIQQHGPMRYESAMYQPAPPPQSLPRSAMGSAGPSSGSLSYGHGGAPAGSEVTWGGPDVSSAAVAAAPPSATAYAYGVADGVGGVGAAPVGIAAYQ